MAITHLAQTEIANSSNENDTLLDTSSVISSDSLEKDLNYIRSVLKKIIGNTNWFDTANTTKLTDISTFINFVSSTANQIKASVIDFSSVSDPNTYSAVLRTSTDWVKLSGIIPGINNLNKLTWEYISFDTSDIDSAIQNTPTILNLSNSINSNNSNIQTQINTINTTLSSHNTRISTLETNVTDTNNPTSLINRVTTAEQNITTNSNNIATINNTISTNINPKIQNLETAVTTLQTNVGSFTYVSYTSTINTINQSLSQNNITNTQQNSDIDALKSFTNLSAVPRLHTALGKNSFILDFKDYNYFDNSLQSNTYFVDIFSSFISLLLSGYTVDILYINFPLDKFIVAEIDNLNQVIKRVKESIYTNFGKNIKIGIYIDLYKVFSNTTYNSFSTTSSDFTQKISSVFTNTNYTFIDAFLLGPLDAVEYYTFDTNTSTYSFTPVTDTLKFVDIVFSNSINFLEGKRTPVILAFRNPDFLLNNFTKITSISSSMKYLIPSTYIYTLNNVDYPYNLELLGADIYYLDALVDPSECGTTYATPYDYSFICAYTDPSRYTSLNTTTPPLIDGSFTSNAPTNNFLYTENVTKLKNKNLLSPVGITNPAVDNSSVFTKSAALVLTYDTTNPSSPTFTLTQNEYKKYQLNAIGRNYVSLLQKQEFVESSGEPSLFNPCIEIASSQFILKPFVSYDYSNTTDGLELLIGIDFTNQFSISLLNNGLFNKESTYTNVFTATLSSGTLTITSGSNTASFTSISAGLHLLKAKFTSTSAVDFTLDMTETPTSLTLNSPINSNKFLLKIQNTSTTQILYLTNIMYY